EPEIYGTTTLRELHQEMERLAQKLDIQLEFLQSNHEGEIITAIQKAKDGVDGLIINPAAFTHYSIGIADAIRTVGLTAIEVHLTNIYAREEFRRKSVIAPVCRGQITGFGVQSYLLALQVL
ncbi:3-dehydroquinate dehydratase, partial [candidate division TA06 bacterium]|nr:3-dehydroquinate dehydratase [candidate division TA06 bacterium]